MKIKENTEPASGRRSLRHPVVGRLYIARVLVFLAGLALAASAVVPISSLIAHGLVFADAPAPPSIAINTSGVEPRQLEDTTTQSVSRVYAKAWIDLDHALSNNDASALNAAFVGFARERYANQIADQLKAGMSLHLTARAHNASATFYGIEGSSLEVRDNVQLERQILDRGKVISTETKTVTFVAILTVVDDSWKVRVLEEAQE
jgi:hypothetical protein